MLKLLKKLLKILLIALGGLFTVYQLNLDMKLIGWVYHLLNDFHARKPKEFEF